MVIKRFLTGDNFTVDCGQPGLVEHGVREVEGTYYMDSAVYSCEENYKLSGPSTIVCQYGGTWSAAPPTCVPDLSVYSYGWYCLLIFFSKWT